MDQSQAGNPTWVLKDSLAIDVTLQFTTESSIHFFYGAIPARTKSTAGTPGIVTHCAPFGYAHTPHTLYA